MQNSGICGERKLKKNRTFGFMFHEIICVTEQEGNLREIDIIFSQVQERPDKYVTVNKWTIVQGQSAFYQIGKH